jgi:hypothetical protein
MTFQRRTIPATLEAVARDYTAALGLPIVLHCPPRGYSSRRLDRRLHVHLHALPLRPLWLAFSSKGSTVRLPVVLGHRLAGADAYAAPGRLAQGVSLTDDDGLTVLHVLFNNVYILFDLVGQPEPLAPLLLRKSLDLALPHVTAWISEVTALPAPRLAVVVNRLRRETAREEALLREAARARAREAYAEQQRRGLRDETRFVEEEVRAAEQVVEELACRLTQEARHLAASRRRLRVLQGETAGAGEAEDDWRRLLGLEGVRDVVVYAGGVRLVTRPIEVAHGGVRYRLGCFEIDLAETGAIAVRNLTDAYGLYDHPHVWNGRPCLGNVREGVAKLVAEYQWVAAAEVLLDFLRTVTPQDWYVPITHWRTASA